MPLTKIHSSFSALNLKYDWPLSQLSTLGTGGMAEIFVQPESVPQLQEILGNVKNCPVYILGGGSNVIIPDGRIPGLVISSRSLNASKWISPFMAEIESGFPLPLLVKTLREKNTGGLEFASGIPGTLGGALYGNAGAGGHGVCEYADSVKAVDRSGEILTFRRGDFSYGYRRCTLRGAVIVSAVMSFAEGVSWNEQAYSDFMSKRRKQPLEFRSAGCTFKNPEGDSAGRLLDECGCKGMRAGDAEVSEKHANFIINRGHASSSDVLELVRMCADRVYERTGARLVPEIMTLSPCFSV